MAEYNEGDCVTIADHIAQTNRDGVVEHIYENVIVLIDTDNGPYWLEGWDDVFDLGMSPYDPIDGDEDGEE
jgi:hypothetical protein